MPKTMTLLAACALMLSAGIASAQQAPPAIGTPISLEMAQKVAAAALAEAKKINVPEAVAIVEPNGQLVYFAKMDNTQYASINVALDKAKSAALYRRPTMAFFNALKGGNTYVIQLRDSNAVPGGIPIVVDGKIIGGIGTSGGTGDQDVQCSEAGLAALK